jgi:hypothetical protein
MFEFQGFWLKTLSTADYVIAYYKKIAFLEITSNEYIIILWYRSQKDTLISSTLKEIYKCSIRIVKYIRPDKNDSCLSLSTESGYRYDYDDNSIKRWKRTTLCRYETNGVFLLVILQRVAFFNEERLSSWETERSLILLNEMSSRYFSLTKLLSQRYNSETLCTIYNMSGRVVSDIQPQAEGEWL